jgi:hypothetical protein
MSATALGETLTAAAEFNNRPPQRPAPREVTRVAPPISQASGLRPLDGAEVDVVICLRLPTVEVQQTARFTSCPPRLRRTSSSAWGSDQWLRVSICTVRAPVVTEHTFYLQRLLY